MLGQKPASNHLGDSPSYQHFLQENILGKGNKGNKVCNTINFSALIFEKLDICSVHSVSVTCIFIFWHMADVSRGISGPQIELMSTKNMK